MRLSAVGLVVGLVAVATEAVGQEANLNVFLFEKSYWAVRGTPEIDGAPAFYHDEAEPDLFAEAQLGIHVPLIRRLNLQKLRDGDGFGFNLFVTPQFRLRALKVPSGPVRSISFMPKFTGQALWALGGDSNASPGLRHIVGFNLVVGHHSNGGATCVFADEEFDDRGECVSSLDPVPPAEQREVRVNNGNFSTNYVELGTGYRLGVTTTSTPSGDHAWTKFAEMALSYQRHHDWVGIPLPGGAVPGFAELYGQSRLRIDLAGFLDIESAWWLRGGLRLDVILGSTARFAGAKHYTLQSELLLASIPFLPDPVGVGVRYSDGMDYYNTQFVRDIKLWQLVLFFDTWTPWLS